MTIKIPIDNVAAILKSVQELVKLRTLVGIPAADPLGVSAGPNQRTGAAGIDNASLGYIHENGAPGSNIPARPFLVPGVQNVLPRAMTFMKAAGESALNGEPVAKIEKNFHAAGLVAQAAVRLKITDGPFEPLKPATIAARRRRHPGRRASTASDVTPLVDTGQLRAAISYVVRKVPT